MFYSSRLHHASQHHMLFSPPSSSFSRCLFTFVCKWAHSFFDRQFCSYETLIDCTNLCLIRGLHFSFNNVLLNYTNHVCTLHQANVTNGVVVNFRGAKENSSFQKLPVRCQSLYSARAPLQTSLMFYFAPKAEIEFLVVMYTHSAKEYQEASLRA